jgi:hypothetical protein
MTDGTQRRAEARRGEPAEASQFYRLGGVPWVQCWAAGTVLGGEGGCTPHKKKNEMG